MSGRSTMVSISFGTALLAGRNRVPSPATGNTALRIGFRDLFMLVISNCGGRLHGAATVAHPADGGKIGSHRWLSQRQQQGWQRQDWQQQDWQQQDWQQQDWQACGRWSPAARAISAAI